MQVKDSVGCSGHRGVPDASSQSMWAGTFSNA